MSINAVRQMPGVIFHLWHTHVDDGCQQQVLNAMHASQQTKDGSVLVALFTIRKH